MSHRSKSKAGKNWFDLYIYGSRIHLRPHISTSLSSLNSAKLKQKPMNLKLASGGGVLDMLVKTLRGWKKLVSVLSAFRSAVQQLNGIIATRQRQITK